MGKDGSLSKIIAVAAVRDIAQKPSHIGGSFHLGRPKAKIDEERVRALAQMQASNEEIAKICRIDRGTLEKYFSAKLKEWKAEGLEVIRFYQWKALKQGSVQMALKLGEIYLPEQRENKGNAPQLTQIIVNRENLPEAEICSDSGILEPIPPKDTSCEQIVTDL